jgi:hypothetical protein
VVWREARSMVVIGEKINPSAWSALKRAFLCGVTKPLRCLN